MIHIYIGDGKGKTTASLGLALRALGWGKRVYFAEFLKDKKFPSGEIAAVKRYKLKIKLKRFNNQVHPMFIKDGKADKFSIKRSVKDALTQAEGYIENKKFDMVILDEILNAVGGGFVSKTILKRIMLKAKNIELIITGRSAPSDLLKMADYVSLIKKVKHPFDRGLYARKAVEY